MNLLVVIIISLLIILFFSSNNENFSNNDPSSIISTNDDDDLKIEPATGQPIRIPGSTLRISGINRYPHVSVVYPQGLIKMMDSIPNETICASRCQSEPGCGAYTYQPKQQVCYLYSKPAPGIPFMQRTPTYYTGILDREEIVMK